MIMDELFQTASLAVVSYLHICASNFRSGAALRRLHFVYLHDWRTCTDAFGHYEACLRRCQSMTSFLSSFDWFMLVLRIQLRALVFSLVQEQV